MSCVADVGVYTVMSAGVACVGVACFICCIAVVHVIDDVTEMTFAIVRCCITCVCVIAVDVDVVVGVVVVGGWLYVVVFYLLLVLVSVVCGAVYAVVIVTLYSVDVDDTIDFVYTGVAVVGVTVVAVYTNAHVYIVHAVVCVVAVDVVDVVVVLYVLVVLMLLLLLMVSCVPFVYASMVLSCVLVNTTDNTIAMHNINVNTSENTTHTPTT